MKTTALLLVPKKENKECFTVSRKELIYEYVTIKDDKGLKTIYMRWSYEISLRNVSFFIEADYDRKTITINGKVFKVEEHTKYTYRLSKNKIEVSTIKDFLYFIKNGLNRNDFWHNNVFAMLKSAVKPTIVYY